MTGKRVLPGWHILSGACCWSGLVLAAASLHAQQPTFRAGVELVTVPVTVTSLDHSTHIAGLTPADFKVTENGARQDVTMVTRERVPISLGLVIDSGESMAVGTRRYLAAEAAQRIVAALQPDDEVSILFLRKTVEEKLPWTRVGDIKELNFNGWNPGGTGTGVGTDTGGAPLNDGVRAALELAERARNPRRAVLMLTAGFEGSSRMSLANLVKTRQQSETAVYGFGLGSADPGDLQAETPNVQLFGTDSGATLTSVERMAPGAQQPARPVLPQYDHLESLVGDSGGVVTRMLSSPEVIMAAKNLVEELGAQYLVGYTPKKPLDGKYRKVKVEVNRRGIYVRHRGGYLAMPLAP
ncbi:MAG: VWA domain-containing protein [Acidobacteriota bacterium]|nr:VWA domain-containing protein [Acidobacteriota bacterium]